MMVNSLFIFFQPSSQLWFLEENLELGRITKSPRWLSLYSHTNGGMT